MIKGLDHQTKKCRLISLAGNKETFIHSRHIYWVLSVCQHRNWDTRVGVSEVDNGNILEKDKVIKTAFWEQWVCALKVFFVCVCVWGRWSGRWGGAISQCIVWMSGDKCLIHKGSTGLKLEEISLVWDNRQVIPGIWVLTEVGGVRWGAVVGRRTPEH